MRCTVCRLPMIQVDDHTTHPGCDDTPEAARIRAEHARDQALAATSDAHPDAMTAALAIIRDAALASATLSANTVRDAMTQAQVPGPVVGAAFRKAASDGLITAAGMTASTEIRTHSHRILQYRSNVCRAVS